MREYCRGLTEWQVVWYTGDSSGGGEDRLPGGARVVKVPVTYSSVLLTLCGELASVTGTLTVPVDFRELYTRDSMADVIKRQNHELLELRLKMQRLCQAMLMQGD